MWMSCDSVRRPGERLQRERRCLHFVSGSMRLIGLPRLWLVLATLSLLASPAFASGVLTFVCDGDLVARTECCCPGGHDGATVGSGEQASVSAGCCCRVSRTEARQTQAVVQSRAGAQTDAQVLHAPALTVAVDVVVPNAQTWPAIRLAHPPPRAVPVLLGKQSFLI